MDVRQLRHFIVLAEQGSFVRAAALLHITQSALSRSIQSLESDLGGPLLDRLGRRSELTPLGRLVLERARSIAAEVDGLVQRARWIEAGDIGQLRVGLGSGPGALLMTPLLTHMAVHHPGVKTTIVRGGAEQQLQQLREGELDALVVDVRRVPPHPDWLITDAVELPAGFVVRAQHPLAQVAGVSWAQLMAYPVASTPLSDEVARLLVGTYGPQANPVSMVSLRCEEIASLLDTVVQTDAIFLGILAAANEGVRQGRLVVLDMAQPLRATARFALVSLARRTAGPGWSLLRTFFERQVVTPYGLGTIPG